MKRPGRARARAGVRDPRPLLAAGIARLAALLRPPRARRGTDARARRRHRHRRRPRGWTPRIDEHDDLEDTQVGAGRRQRHARRRCARPRAPVARGAPRRCRGDRRGPRAASCAVPAASAWSRTPRSGATGSVRSPARATRSSRWSSTSSRSSPPPTPSIGPELAAARTRLGLTRRPAGRAHPDPSARHRVHRGRRLRPVRRRLLRPRPPAHAGPRPRRRRGAAAGVVRRALRRTPRSTRAGSSRPSWPPVPTARSAAPAAARTGRCWSPW